MVTTSKSEKTSSSIMRRMAGLEGIKLGKNFFAYLNLFTNHNHLKSKKNL